MPDPSESAAREARLRQARLAETSRRQQVEARIVDRTTTLPVEGTTGHPTAYVGTRLMIARGSERERQIGLLAEIARALHWRLVADPEPAANATLGGDLGIVTVHLEVEDDEVDRVPDAWFLLQRARLRHGVEAFRGVGLDHVVAMQDLRPAGWDLPHSPDPAGWDLPHAPEPEGWDLPHTGAGDATSRALATYGEPGFGGRQPITYLGPAPARFHDGEISGRRPVVALLDTGCYLDHPWFVRRYEETDGSGRAVTERVVTAAVELGTVPIGLTDAEDPEIRGDLVGPFDGAIDRIAGHGTFIAGLVHQACPDAQILAWRGIPAVTPLIESGWITSLSQIAELNRQWRTSGGEQGHPVDVLSISVGYYHEDEADQLLDPILLKVLDVFARNGTVVVCSAGNDATDRPIYPAAFAPWKDGDGPMEARADRVPVVSVGARNPNRTDALFTNAGSWVRTYVPAASVMSTMPPFRGGMEPVARTVVDGRVRESIDPDDYRGGFALWSGTSFAAPTVAGAVAAHISRSLLSEAPDDSAEAAVGRGWAAVEYVTPIRRPAADTAN